MRAFVTGGYGFIGTHLVKRLLEQGHSVTVYDNLSTGAVPDPAEIPRFGRHRFVHGDILLADLLERSMRGHDVVFHLAANADIPKGVHDTKIDLDSNVLGTFNVLEAMRKLGIKKIIFTSSSAVYGEPKISPVPENYGPLWPISPYGASKIAAEGYISAYSHLFGLEAWIFRFANVVGANMTHGVVRDFVAKLKATPDTLNILGDGQQQKSFIHVSDCIEGMLLATERSSGNGGAFNLGAADTITVQRIAEVVVEEMGLSGVRFTYTGGRRGWPGDVPYVFLDIRKISEQGFAPRYNSEQSVRLAARECLGGAT